MLAKALLIAALLAGVANEDPCPARCFCRKSPQRDYIRLQCGDANTKINTIDDIDLLNVASEIIHLNLSNNLLTTFYPKAQLIALQKLDLSRNHLIELENNQFAELPNLRRLDISGNNIKTIGLLAFAKLASLERLKLNQNQISTIELGTFDPLTNLKQVDISGNPLTCDCGLLWLLDWSPKQSVKLLYNPTCDSPPSFKGLLLRKLKIGVDIHCKSNGHFPIIQMRPEISQVVFEGDPLKLECTAPSLSDTYDSSIEWTWPDSHSKLHFDDISVDTQYRQSTGLIYSAVNIAKLNRNHTGFWSCVLVARQGNHSESINVVVISEDTKYCAMMVTSTNKGAYTWPRTVVNHTVSLPCDTINPSYEVGQQRVSYFCSLDGKWVGLNTTKCSYIYNTTKILEQFSKVNSDIKESAKHFQNYTSVKEHFVDIMDVVFTIEAMENFLKYISMPSLAQILMDVANNILDLPQEYMDNAQYSYGAGAKLVNIMERLAQNGSIVHKSNIAVEVFPQSKSAFSGLKCTWYVEIGKGIDRLFRCATNSQTDFAELPRKAVEASISIPESFFVMLDEQSYELPERSYDILVAMHATSKLFPVRPHMAALEDVRTAVAGAKLVGATTAINLTEPILVTLKTPPGSPSTTTFTPVWWNPSLGAWTPDGCHFSHDHLEHVTFFCHNLGYYGLLQDVRNLEVNHTGAKFKLSHPAIYVGSVILFTSLLVAIVTYLLCYPSIQMPKKAKHSLINLWIAICCLCFLYVFGIYQTENVKICQGVGMLLHYFTLSSMLWMCVGVNCMYKKLSKNGDILAMQDDDLSPDQRIKKPIIGLYFVGWGVAIIVCGISAAINIKEYASANYCFLRFGPPLSSLYIPFTILLIFLVIFFLLIRCAIYNMDSNGHLSEGTQATENVDLDLLESSFPQGDARSVLTASTKTASSETEDPEHAPPAQLKAYMIFLSLYILAWLCCACATVEPRRFFWFADDLFSIVYAILVTVLSAFTLFFYCVARSDVRNQWVVISRWLKRKRYVSDTNQNATLPVADLAVTSRSSSRSSARTKSNSRNSNAFKAVGAESVGSYGEPHAAKINNVNLVVLHRQQYRMHVIPNIIENPTNAAEVFYNPHQSIVARKFFKRQKRHMLKRNNLVTRSLRQDSDSASVMSEVKKDNVDSRNIFGTNSKVNNTNIHVDHRAHRKPHKNPNIFSDSGDEYDSPGNDFILNTEHLRMRNLSKPKPYKTHNSSAPTSKQPPLEDNMRSVSQQCTLDYSSENMSDSILDCKESTIVADFSEQLPHTTDVSEVVSVGSMVDESLPIIYVNPAHDLTLKEVRSRTSSVSASDLDELYQQIRRGPRGNGRFVESLTRNSPCFSDSDLQSFRARSVASNAQLIDSPGTTI